MKHRFLALAAAPLVLAGCVMEPMPPGGPDSGSDICGASAYQYLVGKPGVMLDGMRFSTDVRVIRHGTAVTMDYRADRLNFWLDRRDVIERVNCT
jgi:hypothetical protein